MRVWAFAQPGIPGVAVDRLSFAPYSTISASGDYLAAWSLLSGTAVDFLDPSNPAVANIDVNDVTTQCKREIANGNSSPIEMVQA